MPVSLPGGHATRELSRRIEGCRERLRRGRATQKMGARATSLRARPESSPEGGDGLRPEDTGGTTNVEVRPGPDS
ncbi:MAG TPA: hypothetical protein VGV38_14940 [Pyrinomonadaceae bacterium]|nr:hypothetical protein [Pyrinomonadaceae bacterium]